MAIQTYNVPTDRITHKAKVDFSQRCVQKTIHIVQYDKSLPVIAVELFLNGAEYVLPSHADVKVRWGKRDRTFIYKDALGCDASRHIVYFDVDEQMSFFYGPCNPILEVIISGNKAGSSVIPFEIDRNPIQDGDLESSNEYVDLSKTVQEAKDARDEILSTMTRYYNKEETDKKIQDLGNTVNGRIHTLERQVGRMEEQDLDFDAIINNIRSGYGKDYYTVGDKLLINYNYLGTNYVTPHNIVDHSDATIFEDESEKTVPALWLEWHHTIPLGLAFDPDEIMMVVGPNGMPAGTYYFKVAGDSWASQNGKFIQFTVTNNLTAGQCLKPNSSYNIAMAGKNMVVYADGKSFTALYSFTMSEGQTGIYLGEMYSETDQGQAATYLTLDTEHKVYINHYHRVFLGYNRWKDSLYRQWLNAAGLNWWVAQNIFDRAPSNIESLQGFLTGYDNDFTSRLKTVKRATYKNTVTDDGSTDVTYDKVFLHTIAEINVDGFTSQQNTGGLEGKPWDFYKQLAVGQSNLNANGTFKAWTTYPILIKYALNAQISAQYVFTQSAARALGDSVLFVTTSGYVNTYSAHDGLRCLPACVLC